MFFKEKEEKEEPLYKRVISYIVSILCLLLCLYITIEVINANTNRRPPRIFGVSVSYVPTGSMEPVIHQDSYIMFVKADFNSVEVDDVIVYYNATEEKFIVHRVIAKDEVNRVITCKGDANPVEDQLEVKPGMIYGKYVTTLGFMAIFTGGINQNLIFFILVAIFVIMLGMQIASIIIKGKTEELKKNKQKEKQILREEMKRQILAEELAKLKVEMQQEITSPANIEKEENKANSMEKDIK